MNPGRGGRGGYRGGGGGGRYRGSRGRSPRSCFRYVARNTAGAHCGDASLDPKSASANIGGGNSEIASVDGVTQKFNNISTSDYPIGPNSEPNGVGTVSLNVGNSEQVQNVHKAEQAPKPSDLRPVVSPDYHNVSALSSHSLSSAGTAQRIQSQVEEEENHSSSDIRCRPPVDVVHEEKDPSRTVGSGFQTGQLPQEVQNGSSDHEGTSKKVEFENSHSHHKNFSFDICEERNRSIVRLKTPLHVKNRALRNEMKRRMQGKNIEVIRPGMILLKGYLPLTDQVKLIKSCRDMGLGSGGFYQPGYRDGATIHLKMMCLGKNWDPETSTYGDKRPIDEAKPPPIPDDFQQLVKQAIQECHNYLESHSEGKNGRNMLPPMSPNICIINFYTKTGRLGLHQDKDESPESLRKRLPVVSFSLGDTAEFLYGDQRDIDKADKVSLESGDVLIFGGESRLIFHGVSAIIPDTAPKDLLEETGFKPGRLNLTFREY